MKASVYTAHTLSLLLFCSLLTSACIAEEAAPNKWGFSVGAFLTDQDMNTEFQTTPPGDGFDIEFEKELGLDSSLSVFRLEGFYRFADRHRLDFSVFDLSRSASAVLDSEFQWKDTVYAASVPVDTDFDLFIFKAAYTYELARNEWGYFGLTGGFYVADIKLVLATPSTGEGEVGSATVPLPVIGVRGDYSLSKRWQLLGSAEIFFIDTAGIHGSLVDVLLGIDYRLKKNTAIGIGYNSVVMDIDATEKALRAKLEWDYSGAIAYLKFRF